MRRRSRAARALRRARRVAGRAAPRGDAPPPPRPRRAGGCSRRWPRGGRRRSRRRARCRGRGRGARVSGSRSRADIRDSHARRSAASGCRAGRGSCSRPRPRRAPARRAGPLRPPPHRRPRLARRGARGRTGRAPRAPRRPASYDSTSTRSSVKPGCCALLSLRAAPTVAPGQRSRRAARSSARASSTRAAAILRSRSPASARSIRPSRVESPNCCHHAASNGRLSRIAGSALRNSGSAVSGGR